MSGRRGRGSLSPRSGDCLTLQIVRSFAGLTVHLVFESAVLREGAGTGWPLASTEHGVERGCMDISVYLKGRAWATLLIYNSSFHAFFFFFMKREICFRNKGTWYLCHPFSVRSHGCPLCLCSFGTLHFPAVICLSLSMPPPWVFLEYPHEGRAFLSHRFL